MVKLFCSLCVVCLVTLWWVMLHNPGLTVLIQGPCFGDWSPLAKFWPDDPGLSRREKGPCSLNKQSLQYTDLMYSFPNLEPVCCSIFDFNCCFLTCIQISQEAGQVVWYSHLLKNLPQFIVIYTVKSFGIINKTEVDFFFFKSLAFSMIQWILAIWSLVPLPFRNPT